MSRAAASGTIEFTSVCTNLVQGAVCRKEFNESGDWHESPRRRHNNFAPSVGIAWNVPWFGKGKTVVRTGYGINCSGALRNFITVDGVTNTVPGINLISGGSGLTYAPTTFTSVDTLTLPVPFPTGTPTTSPFPVPVTARNLGITTYSYVSPYTQNWNFEIQRELTRSMSVNVRYVGTKGTKLWSNVDLNTLNWLQTEGSSALFDAFNTARSGGESPLLDQLFKGIRLSGTCTGGTVTAGVTCTGAQIIRSNTTTRAQLANGSFGAFLNSLNGSLNYIGNPVSDFGSILRHAGFPDNYLVPDPQYSTVNIAGNNQNSTYHALNIQFTRRMSRGFTSTTTYIRSKALGAGSTIDPLNRNTKTLQTVDHANQISSNGTYELPFGDNHYILGDAPGWIQNIVNNMQVSGILNYSTGAPLSITTTTNTITNSAATPNIAGAFTRSLNGKVSETANGVNYFSGYTQVADPGFSQVSPVCATATTVCNGLLAGYSNKALADANGNIILMNPQPGDVGSLGQSTLRGPGRFVFDMNLVKQIKLAETRSVELRLDVVNILNHPNFGNPSTALNSNGTFGRITSLSSGSNIGGNGGMRSFVINTRFNF